MELYSESIENAVASWKVVQGLGDYKTIVGELLFREIFTISPGAINMFGFGEGVDCYDLPETLFKLPAFQTHTNGVVTMLETALVMMLGNDMESLAEALSDLGAKHVIYGIQPPHYIIVESALVRTLELGLGEKFTTSLRKDWEAVFRFVSRTMMMGAESRVEIVKSKRRTAERTKVATLRLNAISPGKRSKALTRDSRTGSGRFEGEPKCRSPRRGSDAPQQPSRWATEEYLRCSRSLSELPDYVDFDDETIESTEETGKMTETEHGEEPFDSEAYWAWGNDSNVEPPKMPKRANLPLSPIPKSMRTHRSSSVSSAVVRTSSFESLASVGSHDSAPTFPRRANSPTRKNRKSHRSQSKTPPVLLRNSSFDSVSTIGSQDLAPVFPKRASSPSRRVLAMVP